MTIKWNTVYKYISYSLIIYGIDLKSSFEKAGGKLPVKLFWEFLKNDLKCEPKFSEDEILDIIEDLTQKSKDIELEEVLFWLDPFNQL